MATNETLLQTQFQNILEQLSDARADIKLLYQKTSELSSGCQTRHRLNLTAELSKVEVDLKTLKANLTSLDDSVEDINTTLTDAVGKLNIAMVKLEELESNIQKTKENKTNFIIQIIIIVLASIITAIIGVVGSFTWTGIKNATTSSQTQTNNSIRLTANLVQLIINDYFYK